MHKCSPWRLVAIVILATSLLLGPVRSGWAFFDELAGTLSIEKEKQLGEQFLLELQQEVPCMPKTLEAERKTIPNASIADSS